MNLKKVKHQKYYLIPKWKWSVSSNFLIRGLKKQVANQITDLSVTCWHMPNLAVIWTYSFDWFLLMNCFDVRSQIARMFGFKSQRLHCFCSLCTLFMWALKVVLREKQEFMIKIEWRQILYLCFTYQSQIVSEDAKFLWPYWPYWTNWPIWPN